MENETPIQSRSSFPSQPEIPFPPKKSEMSLEKGGFIFHDGKYYKIVHQVTSQHGEVVKQTHLDPLKHKKVYQQTMDLLKKRDLPSLNVRIDNQQIALRDGDNGDSLKLTKPMQREFKQITKLIKKEEKASKPIEKRRIKQEFPVEIGGTEETGELEFPMPDLIKKTDSTTGERFKTLDFDYLAESETVEREDEMFTSDKPAFERKRIDTFEPMPSYEPEAKEKTKSPLTVISEKISTSWQKFVNFIDTKQKESRESALKEDLTKLWGQEYPLSPHSNVIGTIAADKNLYNEVQDFLKLAGKHRKMNLKNLQVGRHRKRNWDDAKFMYQKDNLQESLKKMLLQDEVDDFINKIADSAGMISTQSIGNLLDSAKKPKALVNQNTQEGFTIAKQLASHGFEQWGKGQLAKFEIKNNEMLENSAGEQIFTKGDFVLSYTIPPGEEISQITIELDLSDLAIITLDNMEKVLELLKIALSKDPALETYWLETEGEPAPLDEKQRNENKLRNEVRNFLGKEYYQKFIHIAKRFCDQAHMKTGKVLMSLGHPELNLSDVNKITLEQLNREEVISSRLVELNNQYGLDLSGRIDDLTLKNDGVLHLKGDLKPGKELKAFPKELEIEGNLDLRDCSHLPVPEGLKFGGHLFVSGNVFVPPSYKFHTNRFF